MAGGNKAGLFNLALASLAAGAAAFAIFAMPRDLLQAWIDAVGVSTLIDFRIGPAVRLGLTALGAGLAFFLSWFALRSCDPPRRQTDIEVVEELDDDWLAQRLSGRRASIATPATVPLLAEEDADDPFVELARSAERVEGPLELCREQIEPEAPMSIDDPDSDSDSARELLARVQSSTPAAAGASGLVQRLNAGLAESEWPIPPGQEEASADAEDRLRDVLVDLQALARRA